NAGFLHSISTAPVLTRVPGCATTRSTNPSEPARTNDSSGTHTTPSVSVWKGAGITQIRAIIKAASPAVVPSARARTWRKLGLVTRKVNPFHMGTPIIVTAVSPANTTATDGH